MEGSTRGASTGPNCGSVTGRYRDPKQAVESRYLAYSVTTKDDNEVTGVIDAETPTSLTLKLPGGLEQVLLKKDLKELRASKLSLMPEGFEKALSKQDVADLIAAL